MPYNDDAREPSSVTGKALGAVALTAALGGGGYLGYKKVSNLVGKVAKKGEELVDNLKPETLQKIGGILGGGKSSAFKADEVAMEEAKAAMKARSASGKARRSNGTVGEGPRKFGKVGDDAVKESPVLQREFREDWLEAMDGHNAEKLKNTPTTIPRTTVNPKRRFGNVNKDAVQNIQEVDVSNSSRILTDAGKERRRQANINSASRNNNAFDPNSSRPAPINKSKIIESTSDIDPAQAIQNYTNRDKTIPYQRPRRQGNGRTSNVNTTNSSTISGRRSANQNANRRTSSRESFIDELNGGFSGESTTAADFFK